MNHSIDNAAPRASAHIALAVLTAATLLAATANAARADEKSTCVASYERSQGLRREGKLRRAREELRQCSRAACPSLVRSDCMTWLEQVDASFPSLVIRAERDGTDIAAVRVVLDNDVIASRLDGKSIDVEPGEHALRFETEGAPPVSLTLVVREGEKNRIVPVRFAPSLRADGTSGAGEAGSASLERPIPVGIWVLGGVGLAGLAGFGIIGAVGKGDESSLRDTCSPNCAKSDIDAVRTKYLFADLSLGVGIASLGAGLIWYALRPHSAEAPPPAASAFTVAPAPGGGFVGWNRTF